MEKNDPNMQKASEDENTIPFAQAEREGELGDYKKQKYVTLYKARTILSQIGTMPERQLCRKQLKRMQKHGLNSI